MILDNVPSETSQKPAPLCPVGKSAPQMKVRDLKMADVVCCIFFLVLHFCLNSNSPNQDCKCASGPVTKGLDGNPRGGWFKGLFACVIHICILHNVIQYAYTARRFSNCVQPFLMLIFMIQVVSSPWPTMASRSWRRDGASLRTSRFLLYMAIWVPTF